MIKISRMKEGILFAGDLSSLCEKDMQNLGHLLTALESEVVRKSRVKC